MAIVNTFDVEKLYDEYADMLYRLALSHLGNREDAMDTVQDVFVKYVTLNKKMPDNNYRKAWFIRVTINRCYDLLRRRKLRDYTPLDEIGDVADKNECEIPQSVRSMLECVSEKYRTVLVLHYLEGFSIEEIANILNATPSAVKMRLLRAREAVKGTHNKESLYD